MLVGANVERARRFGFEVRLRPAKPPAESRELAGNLLRAQHEIHTASLDGMSGHRREARRFRLLREGESARVLDLAKPERAIRVAT
jgi:hypothetical protein